MSSLHTSSSYLLAALLTGTLTGAATAQSPVSTPQTPSEREGLIAVEAVNATVRPEKREVSEERARQLQLPPGFRAAIFEPFARGWLLVGGRAHFGRLMGLTQMPDGSLRVGDDDNGVIYRISYQAR